eukprot:scaffold7703_cov103-Isochrysis_galbana.AAC.2
MAPHPGSCRTAPGGGCELRTACRAAAALRSGEAAGGDERRLEADQCVCVLAVVVGGRGGYEGAWMWCGAHAEGEAGGGGARSCERVVMTLGEADRQKERGPSRPLAGRNWGGVCVCVCVCVWKGLGGEGGLERSVRVSRAPVTPHHPILSFGLACCTASSESCVAGIREAMSANTGTARHARQSRASFSLRRTHARRSHTHDASAVGAHSLGGVCFAVGTGPFVVAGSVVLAGFVAAAVLPSPAAASGGCAPLGPEACDAAARPFPSGLRRVRVSGRSVGACGRCHAKDEPDPAKAGERIGRVQVRAEQGDGRLGAAGVNISV